MDTPIALGLRGRVTRRTARVRGSTAPCGSKAEGHTQNQVEWDDQERGPYRPPEPREPDELEPARTRRWVRVGFSRHGRDISGNRRTPAPVVDRTRGSRGRALSCAPRCSDASREAATDATRQRRPSSPKSARLPGYAMAHPEA